MDNETITWYIKLLNINWKLKQYPSISDVKEKFQCACADGGEREREHLKMYKCASRFN